LFIPDNFKIPTHLSNEQFHFEVLDPAFCVLDYEAVMSSKERLHHVFSQDDNWPEEDMSFESNRNDLIMHAADFNARKAFAYAVLNLEKDAYIGCVYINPTEQENYDCEVYLWVKDSELLLDKFLFQSVENWLQEEWPFRRRAYPGRTISWEDWK